MKRIGVLIYITVFCIVLLIPAGMWLCGIQEPFPFFDNRRPARMPELDILHLDPYPQQMEAFINDNFPLRNTAIHWLNISNARFFSVFPKPEIVTVGADGWLYEGEDDANFVLGMKPIADSLISLMIEELNDRQEYCKSIGAEFRLVIIPNKLTMYPEHWPAHIRLAQKYPTPVEQLLSRSNLECDVPILYLRDSLKQHKGHHQLYPNADSHWNHIGTYFGYRYITRWLRNDPALSITPFSDITATVDTIRYSDLSYILGMEEWKDTIYNCSLPLNPSVTQVNEPSYPCDSSWFSYCWEHHQTFTCSDTTLPRILIMRDSFTNTLMRGLLSPHFSRCTFIWDYWQHKLNKEIIASEKPDIVVCIMNERFLLNLVKYRHRNEIPGGRCIQQEWIKWW